MEQAMARRTCTSFKQWVAEIKSQVLNLSAARLFNAQIGPCGNSGQGIDGQ